MAVVARFGFFGAHGVRHKRAEGRAAESFGGNSLLHVINPVAILILRTDHDGARGTHRGHAMAGHRAIDSEHETVVAQYLKIVAGPVARGQAFVVQHGLALVGHHRKMAAETIRGPGGVAGITGHAAVGVRQLRRVGGHVAPRFAVGLNRFGPRRFLIVMLVARSDGVEGLHHFPFFFRVNHRTLE